MGRNSQLIWTVLAIILSVPAAQRRAASETPVSSRPSFEVASIKLGDPASNSVGVHLQPGGRFDTNNTSLKILIEYAYDLKDFQVTGGPGWMGADRFSIVAKGDARIAFSIPANPQEIDMSALGKASQNARLMLQSLLADRFKLANHWETKELPTYNLVVAKGGPKLRVSESPSDNLNGGRGQLTGIGATIAHLIQSLAQQLGRPIVDNTGLTGKYDFTLNYTPEAREGVFGEAVVPDPSAPSDPNVTTIFTALQEQVGLKLESATGPVQILVVDHVEKPTID